MDLFRAGTGKYQVTAKVIVLDSGINITLSGGEYSHIGSVVIALPRPSLADAAVISVTSSVFNMVGHKDEEVARPAAEKIAVCLNQPVVITAGMHIDKATAEDIEVLLRNTRLIIDRIIAKLQKGKTKD